MIYFSLLLHIYQPPTQDLEMTKRITDESYRLLLKIFNTTKAKVNINIPASLTEQLVLTGGEDVIRGLRQLTARKQVELTQTAAYHPILPLLPQDQIKRQIELNISINKKYLGDEIACLDGFFPPEMAYSTKVSRVIRQMGFQWVILDELSYTRDLNQQDHTKIYITTDKNNRKDGKNIYQKKTGKEMKYFFRDDELSLSIALSRIKSLVEFQQLLNKKVPSTRSPAFTEVSAGKQVPSQNSYFILAMDGETFGHHQPGQDKLLVDILSSYKEQFVSISELGKYIRTKKEISPLQGSWGCSVNDLRKKIFYPKWNHPENQIHKLQWRLLNLAVKYALMNNVSSTKYPVPSLFDKALHSDQFWWAAEKPIRHPGMIEMGAKMLKESIFEKTGINDPVRKEADSLYCDIVTKL